MVVILNLVSVSPRRAKAITALFANVLPTARAGSALRALVAVLNLKGIRRAKGKGASRFIAQKVA